MRSTMAKGVAVMASIDFQGFILQNRARINRYLNTALWLFIATGPAIALGVYAGIFPHTDYLTCLNISILVTILSGAHLILVKCKPYSPITSVFALTALDAIMVYMVLGHVNIHITWFLVPFLSILYCDKRLYFYALTMNYAFMLGCTWAASSYYVGLHPHYGTEQAYFFNTVGGYTIETLIMAVSGYLAVKIVGDYFEGLFQQQAIIEDKEENEQEKMHVLASMAEIYDNVNLISFVDNTEVSLRDPSQQKFGIDMQRQTHTAMNQRIKKRVMPDHLEDFLAFTNITTVRERMRHKKVISADFIDVVSGWFRAQYIAVEEGADGMPDVVIYTTRNVDDEKKRVERLVRLSMTDELTRLYNRRSFVDALAKLREGEMDDDLVMFSIDVNGLKVVNDTKGHAAGDELIKGAAECMVLSIGQAGKVYRTGGDEFMAIVHTREPWRVRDEIQRKAGEWSGVYSDEVTLAIGYASRADNPGASVDDLEHMADASMYAEKDRFYREAGIDRRWASFGLDNGSDGSVAT